MFADFAVESRAIANVDNWYHQAETLKRPNIESNVALRYRKWILAPESRKNDRCFVAQRAVGLSPESHLYRARRLRFARPADH